MTDQSMQRRASEDLSGAPLTDTEVEASRRPPSEPDDDAGRQAGDLPGRTLRGSIGQRSGVNETATMCAATALPELALAGIGRSRPDPIARPLNDAPRYARAGELAGVGHTGRGTATA